MSLSGPTVWVNSSYRVKIRQKNMSEKKKLTNLNLSLIHVSGEIRNNNFLRSLGNNFGGVNGRSGSSTDALNGGYSWLSEHLGSS